MLTLIWCPFHPVLLQWHVKDSSLSAKNAGGRLHLNTHTPLTQRSRSGLTILSMHSVGTLSGNKLTHNSSGNTRSQSSQLAEPLWTNPGIKSGISVHKLISTLKKKAQMGNEVLNILPNSSQVRKKPPLCAYSNSLRENVSPGVFLQIYMKMLNWFPHMSAFRASLKLACWHHRALCHS